jgi:hypothetical protein
MNDIDRMAYILILCPAAARARVLELLGQRLCSELKQQCRTRDEALAVAHRFADDLCARIYDVAIHCDADSDGRPN